ncbi:TetR/AcrR family transcriptional regulator [Bacteroides pyogenes]|uniref:TetR/AcrR family transcriptional regulator n=1 Tax=Bacteroides pyogenes TaxID=310300 RepID=UPI001F467644|nr:TetR/AcrR family transcriptional regulator [Bacteroides pyogenes]
MAATDWFNKPVENSRELILKEAFKLFLQKNVEKVKVSELERVNKLQRGAIFYHFKDKETIFRDTIKQYFSL